MVDTNENNDPLTEKPDMIRAIRGRLDALKARGREDPTVKSAIKQWGETIETAISKIDGIYCIPDFRDLKELGVDIRVPTDFRIYTQNNKYICAFSRNSNERPDPITETTVFERILEGIAKLENE